jgi:hypothetical protein
MASFSFNPSTSLKLEGDLQREQLIALLKELIDDNSQQESYFISCLVVECTNVYADELYDDVEKLFKDGVIIEHIIGFDEFEEEFKQSKEVVINKLKSVKNNRYITDTISSIERWACFHENQNRHISSYYDYSSKGILKDGKIGKNQFCPCGSGKKYKKCCG